MTRVTLEALVKRYGTTTAVNGIDLTVGHGEFVVLLGPSGCGKTTTLRCIAGLEAVTDGRITFDDAVVSTAAQSVPPERRCIGMVFQSYAVWPHMSVEENVAFGLKLKRGLKRDVIKARVASALELVGLGPYAKRGVYQLSGGQQQRVALARAIVLEPRLLLFDEPLSNLDAKLREQMREELRDLQKRLGITSIYVTHDQEEAMVVADRIVLMQGGNIVQVATPSEIYSEPRTLFAATFIGASNILRGTVTSTDTGARGIRVQNDFTLTCSDTDLADGHPVDALIRPEHIAISTTQAEGSNVVRGEVARCAFMGNSADLTIACRGLVLKAQLSPARRLEDGTPVWLKIDPVQIRLLSLQT